MRSAVRALVPLLLAFASGTAAAATAAAPASSGDGRPVVRFCYNEQLGAPDGGHFTLMLMRQVTAALPDVRLRMQALPWMRCLIQASRGEADAILGASHTPERALDLVYPRDAEGQPDAERQLFAQGYRLLRRRGDALDIDGTRFVDLVGPIGVERGHSSASFARAGGATIDENHPDVQAMLSKLRSGRLGGVLVAEPQYASLRAQDGALAGLEAVPRPLQQRPYFIVFSRDFVRRRPLLAERIWSEAVRQRDTPAIRRATAEQQGTAFPGAMP
jgi:polar amino acid transport system substrate-binding protein